MIKKIQVNGRTRYQDERGRFVSNKEGRSQYIRDNIGLIRTGRVKYENLDRNEKITFHAQNRLRFNGKYLSKSEEQFVRERASQEKEFLPPGADIAIPRDLGGLGYTVRPREFLDGQTLIKYTNDNMATKTAGFNASAELNRAIKSGESTTVIAPNGLLHIGLEGIRVLQNFEREIRRDAKAEGLKAIILHRVETIYKNGEQSIQIDLRKTIIITSEI